MTLRSDLIEELEQALTDEAYDGGMGALTPDEFASLVQRLAVTAAGVVAEVGSPPADRVADVPHGEGEVLRVGAHDERDHAVQVEVPECGLQVSSHTRLCAPIPEHAIAILSRAFAVGRLDLADLLLLEEHGLNMLSIRTQSRAFQEASDV